MASRGSCAAFVVLGFFAHGHLAVLAAPWDQSCVATGRLGCGLPSPLNLPNDEDLTLLQLELTQKRREIPDRLVMNHFVNLLNVPTEMSLYSRETRHRGERSVGDADVDNAHHWGDIAKYARNTKENIALYNFADVEFLDNDGCFNTIRKVHSDKLAQIFKSFATASTSRGTHKRKIVTPSGQKKKVVVPSGGGAHGAAASDICRLAQLYEHGGYYFDSDMPAVQDLRNFVPAEASFVSVITNHSNTLFNSLIGVAPRHPIIALAMDLALEDGGRAGGPAGLTVAWKRWTGEATSPGLHRHSDKTTFQQSYLFEEVQALNGGGWEPYKKNVGETLKMEPDGKGIRKVVHGDAEPFWSPCSDGFFVGDRPTGEIVFWSRMRE